MNYKLLNEVLIEWNESFKEDSDNVFLKSEDIKESLDRYFIYRPLNYKVQIKIFDAGWHEFKKYKDKVWINGKHVELNDNGWTIDEFEPGEYKVYIKGINEVKNCFGMFFSCKQLVSGFIPDSVTGIAEGMFSGCTGLINIIIPDSVAVIGYSMFSGCSGLASVTIPNSVTKIGDYAFYNCRALTSITIPNSITEIGEWAFASCINIKTVYVKDINKFNQINFVNKTADPRYYGAKLIELKK